LNAGFIKFEIAPNAYLIKQEKIMTPTPTSLHLRYRIWIAEMNSDINIIRIYNDYLQNLKDQDKNVQLKTIVGHFEKTFSNMRQEIDTLRNDMHLLKMKLAAIARKKESLDNTDYRSDNHVTLKQRYMDFRKNFELMKRELENLVKSASNADMKKSINDAQIIFNSFSGASACGHTYFV
jgi:hypothetical protein